MENLIDELISEFNTMTLDVDKNEIKKMISSISKTKKSKNIAQDINSLINDFSNMDISKNEQLQQLFHIFILECLQYDNSIINSMLFAPPGYQECH